MRQVSKSNNAKGFKLSTMDDVGEQVGRDSIHSKLLSRGPRPHLASSSDIPMYGHNTGTRNAHMPRHFMHASRANQTDMCNNVAGKTPGEQYASSSGWKPFQEAYVARQSGAAAPRAVTINSRDRQCLAPTNKQTKVIQAIHSDRVASITPHRTYTCTDT